MEPKFQNSFIPKKPMGLTQNPGVEVKHPTNIFSVIAGVIFVGALLTSGGLFAYSKILTGQINKADKAIIDARTTYEPEKIKELIDMDSKITSAKDLLRDHVSASKILVLFEELTIKKMRFNTFDYVKTNGVPIVTVAGEVQTYNALAQQQEVFSSSQFIGGHRITEFNLGDNGYITVKFTADLDPSVISYKKSIDSMISN